MTGGHRCEPVVDAEGTVIGHALVSPDISDECRRAVDALAQAMLRQWEAQDAADPDGAEEQGRRQAAAIARVRGRVARLRGEGP